MSEAKKNKIFWSIFTLLILGSIGMTYVRVFILKDYILVSEVSCNPDEEACFEYTPEELCEESEDSNCLLNTQSEFYKIIHKKAAHVEACNPADLEEGEECPELMCEEDEEECYYEYNEEKE